MRVAPYGAGVQVCFYSSKILAVAMGNEDNTTQNHPPRVALKGMEVHGKENTTLLMMLEYREFV